MDIFWWRCWRCVSNSSVLFEVILICYVIMNSLIVCIRSWLFRFRYNFCIFLFFGLRSKLSCFFISRFWSSILSVLGNEDLSALFNVWDVCAVDVVCARHFVWWARYYFHNADSLFFYGHVVLVKIVFKIIGRCRRDLGGVVI